MSRWRPSFSDILKTAAHQLEKRYDWTRAKVKRRMGWIAPPIILPYRGYGNPRELIVMGRVLEDRPLREPQEADTWWTNAKAMYRRFATDEIAAMRVRAQYDGRIQETVTDQEGYFRFHIELETPVNRQVRWHPVKVELLDQIRPDQGPVDSTARVLVPSEDSQIGIISDIDDTIIKSHATDFMKLARLTVFKNVHTRSPLPGVGRFYRALEAGADGQSQNPFFYVSSSAWNLYDVFCDFLDLHNLPTGTILLHDLAFDEQTVIKSGHAHKFEKIEQIMRICDELPYVLVGDAGQDDPLIYREVVRRFPGRIRAIYIRAVASKARNQKAREMAEEIGELGTPMLLVEDIEQAISHAEDLQLVQEGA